jgi:hypothetical protein
LKKNIYSNRKQTIKNTVTIINEFTFSATLTLVPHPACLCEDNRKPSPGWKRKACCKALWICKPLEVTLEVHGPHMGTTDLHPTLLSFQLLSCYRDVNSWNYKDSIVSTRSQIIK